MERSHTHETECELTIAGVKQTITLAARYVVIEHDHDRGYEIEIMSVRAPVVAIKEDSLSMDWMLSADALAAIERDIRENI